MKFTLKNGAVVDIRLLSHSDKPAELRAFMVSLINEKPEPYIRRNRAPTLAEEKELKKRRLTEQRNKKTVSLVARINGKIAGMGGASLETMRDADKARLGIAIAKRFRGIGLGTILFKELIKLTKKILKPRLIYLGCLAANKPAHAMYRKLGFHEFARFKKWQKHRGKYEDMIFMKLGFR